MPGGRYLHPHERKPMARTKVNQVIGMFGEDENLPMPVPEEQETDNVEVEAPVASSVQQDPVVEEPAVEEPAVVYVPAPSIEPSDEPMPSKIKPRPKAPKPAPEPAPGPVQQQEPLPETIRGVIVPLLLDMAEEIGALQSEVVSLRAFKQAIKNQLEEN